MALPKNFLSALQEALAEHRARATLDALRRLASTMTFAELHAVLSSADGQRLGSTPVRALFEGITPPPPVAEPEVEAPRSSTRPSKRSAAKTPKARKKPAKKSAKKSSKKSSSERHRQPTAVDAAIVELLAKLAKPTKSGLLRARLHVSQTTLLRALKRLVDAGRVVTVDPHPRPTYALANTPTATPTATETAAPTPAAGPTTTSQTAKKSSKKASRKSAPVEPAATSAATSTEAAPSSAGEPSPSPARLDIKHLEVALLNVLQRSGDWMGATELRELVGGNRDHAYRALVSLVESGQVEREGERQFTRYRIHS